MKIRIYVSIAVKSFLHIVQKTESIVLMNVIFRADTELQIKEKAQIQRVKSTTLNQKIIVFTKGDMTLMMLTPKTA